MNTRFSPTTNGSLHLGHIYMALVNQYMARSTGGQFILRFEDNIRSMMDSPEAMMIIADEQLKDLEWMGIKPDCIYYQSEEEAGVKDYLARTKFQPVIDHGHESWDNAPHVHVPHIPRMRVYAWGTVERVILDAWEGVTAVIRGLDLLSEHHLYIYLCALLGIPFPRCYYLPRLSGPNMTDISKTLGNWRVSGMRDEGYTREGVLGLLAHSCLRTPTEDWHIDNIRYIPMLDEDFEKS